MAARPSLTDPIKAVFLRDADLRAAFKPVSRAPDGAPLFFVPAPHRPEIARG